MHTSAVIVASPSHATIAAAKMSPPGVSVSVQRTMRRLGSKAKSKQGTLVEQSSAFAGHLPPLIGAVTDIETSQEASGPAHFEKTFNAKPEDRAPAATRAAMEWWLKTLTPSGFELAPELQAENHILFEIFHCGTIANFSRGQVIQDEGVEVKHYSIILFGQCKLRCAKPAVGVAPVVPVIDDAKGCEPDAFINIEVLGRGEAIGLLPGEPRSPYNIVCTEKTMILRLSSQDYDATLKPFHREFFSKTVDFLHQHNICPEANGPQLRKIAPFLRQRRVPRGRIFIRSGECQRFLYFLIKGSCSVLVHDSPDGVGGAVPLDEEEQDEDDDDDAEDRHDKFLQMRSTSYGARMQQTAAFDERRRDVVKSMARGPMRQTLAGGKRHIAFKVSHGDMYASASLSNPGLMLGEEAFVHDNFRDWVNLRNCYSVRAASNCLFYVADISAFKLFITYMTGAMPQMINEKLNRRCKQFTRTQSIQKKVNKRAQEMKANELAKLSRQQLRLPKCAGYPAVDELEDVEDYLDVVFEHRKPPPDTIPPTLTVLDGTGYGPKSNNGPGVSALLKAMAEDGCIGYRSNSHLSRLYRDSSSYEDNPMGVSIPAEAKYEDVAPPSPPSNDGPLAISDAPPLKALTRCESLPELSINTGWGGVFLNTEVDFDDGMTISIQQPTLSTSTSLPSLSQHQSVSKSEDEKVDSKVFTETSTKPSRSESHSLANKRHQRIMKAYNRVMPGKSVLILTDKKDLRKQITRVLLADDVSVLFIKNSKDLWQRLRAPKEKYDILLLDLTKTELNIDGMLRTIRQQENYAQLPIVVLSLERELSDAVRSNCSFVVYLPLSASMIREALVWCFDDRKSVQKVFQSEESQEVQLLEGKAPAVSLMLPHPPLVA